MLNYTYNCHYEKTGSEIKNIDDELPFEIPDCWCWVRLSSIANISAGEHQTEGIQIIGVVLFLGLKYLILLLQKNM